jgi:hypothetical protein
MKWFKLNVITKLICDLRVPSVTKKFLPSGLFVWLVAGDLF